MASPTLARPGRADEAKGVLLLPPPLATPDSILGLLYLGDKGGQGGGRHVVVAVPLCRQIRFASVSHRAIARNSTLSRGDLDWLVEIYADYRPAGGGGGAKTLHLSLSLSLPCFLKVRFLRKEKKRAMGRLMKRTSRARTSTSRSRMHTDVPISRSGSPPLVLGSFSFFCPLVLPALIPSLAGAQSTRPSLSIITAVAITEGLRFPPYIAATFLF